MRYHRRMDQSPHTPRAFATVAQFPALLASVEGDLERQRARIGSLLGNFQARPRLRALIEETIAASRGGLVVLEGLPGSGVSSMLAALAARRPYPLWMPAEAPGAASLYAQLVALYRPGVPLVDPTSATDPAALEQLLAEIAASRPGGAPLTLLIDELDPPGQPLRPGPLQLPAELPPGVTVLLGSATGAPLPYQPVARLRLPEDDPELREVQTRALLALGCREAWVDPLIEVSRGNFLYLGLAFAWLRERRGELGMLPRGLDALMQAWWNELPAPARRLAAMFVAAGQPLPLPVAAEALGADPAKLIAGWARLGLLELSEATPPAEDEQQAEPVALAALAHRALAALLGRIAPQALALAHHELAALAIARAEDESAAARQRIAGPGAGDPVEGYLRRQIARHSALGPIEWRDATLPRLAHREWLVAHERRGSLEIALGEARWELRVAAGGDDTLRMVRATALAGMLATRARTLTPDAAAEALQVGMAAGSREHALKRVLDSVERLPDGHGKAQILRRLGEICYNSRMRPSAMRLLSRALDLEAAPTSRAWRDTRDSLLAALAGAALELQAFETTLAIAERVEHLERRAMIETQVVRSLLAAGDRDRAQRLARGILHESMGAWARAEVAVELVRAGDQRGALLLEEISLETVSAWAQIELAHDEVAHDEAAARRRIEALSAQGQRDRGLARIARAMAMLGNDGEALAAAEAISEVETRVATLIDLRLSLEGLVAMLALERATKDIGAVTGDDRVPLVAALAAALAALGRRDRALALAAELPEGEERDRALARVAVALAQRGERAEARELLASIDDEDERAWASEEFARLLAAEGRWDEAMSVTAQIASTEQREHAAADLAIERARAGEGVAALAAALAVEQPVERARALTLIAPALVAAEAVEQAQAVAGDPRILTTPEARGRYLAAVAIALAANGRFEQAATVVAGLRRPTDRARAGAALAQALAGHSSRAARRVLGATLRTATVGREEAYRALEHAAPALAALGGAQLLAAAAQAVDEIDRW
jgi:tetratricopeptide (TPR) repeat protein